jgi:4'-phosphopantetheinyl transferase EntD
MIESVLPDWVLAAEAFGDCSQDPRELLWPAELELIDRAVPKRRAEFTTVRVCARAALAELGVAPAPILPGERGAPTWPAGVVGSMTHCAGYRAAAVAHDRFAASIGIDAEPHASLPDGVLAMIARPEEHDRLTELSAAVADVHWDRLLFSIKESVYKAWFPLTRRWLDFQEASITIDPAGTFTAALLVPGPILDGQELTGFSGRFAVSDSLMVSTIAVAAGHR